MILITTSRDPSRNTRAFARTLANLIPYACYEPRGKKSIQDLVELAKNKGYERICFVHDEKGNPGKLSFININKTWEWAEEIKIIGITYKRIRKPFKELRVKENGFVEKMFKVENTEDAELIAYEKGKEITFLKDREKILRIKLKEDVK